MLLAAQNRRMMAIGSVERSQLCILLLCYNAPLGLGPLSWCGYGRMSTLAAVFATLAGLSDRSEPDISSKRFPKMRLRGSKADQYNKMSFMMLYMTREDEMALERCSRKRSTGSSVPRFEGGDDGGEDGKEKCSGTAPGHLADPHRRGNPAPRFNCRLSGRPPGRGSLALNCLLSQYNHSYQYIGVGRGPGDDRSVTGSFMA